MRKTKHASRTPEAFSLKRLVHNFPLFPVLAATVIIVGLVYFSPFGHHVNQGAAGGVPPKPSGTQVSTTSLPEHWTQAQGLPKQILNLAFSTKAPGVGYAAAFVNKQTQAMYHTTDSGTTWQLVSTVQAPVADIVSSDPSDSQDIVFLSLNAPAPGTYVIHRSYDGGRTWQTQSTSLPSSATISKTGWYDSTFLVGFQLDRQPSGDSALVAFPAKNASYHLDVDGKINGIAIPHIQLITGHNSTLQIWGVDDAQTPRTIGLGTANMGNSWSVLATSVAGTSLMPVTVTDDGNTFLAVTADQAHVAVSKDGGSTWSLQQGLGNGKYQTDHAAFVTQSGQVLLKVSNNANPGTYGFRNGAWVNVTARDVVAITSDASGNLFRLWSYDANGEVTWTNY